MSKFGELLIEPLIRFTGVKGITIKTHLQNTFYALKLPTTEGKSMYYLYIGLLHF
jgi:hypothetical protein